MPVFCKCTLIILASIVFHTSYAQQTQLPAKIKTAPVEVTVINAAKQPRTEEQVLFKAKKTGTLFQGRTDKAGKLSIALPAGDEYAVMLNTINDSTYFGKLPIPAIGENETYTKPFVIGITYEPAKTFTLSNVYFETGKAVLQPASFKQLGDLLEFMKSKASTRIEISGHTDNIGTDNDNTILSQKRAEAVKAWLVQKGITANRVVAKGYGASMPVADNSTEEGRQQNRRTEVKIL